jgi:hypothetical protein
VFAVGATSKGVVPKTQQRGHVGVCDDPHVAATTAVTTVGPAFSNVRLAAKTHAAGTAITRFGVQLGRIDK